MRKAIALIVVFLVAYIAYGTYHNSYYPKMIRSREQATQADPSKLKIALVYGQHTADSFRTGAEVAVADTSQSARRVEAQRIEIAEGSISLESISHELRLNPDVSIMLADAPYGLESSLAVSSETYGVGTLLVNAGSPFVSSAGFRYVNLVEPSFRKFCEGMLDKIPVIAGKNLDEPIHLGVFFDPQAGESDNLLNTLLQATEQHNETYRAANDLRGALAKGILREDDSLEEISKMYFLTSQLSIDHPIFNRVISELKSNPNRKVTVGDVISATSGLTNRFKPLFTRSISPEGLNPARLAEANRIEPGADCLIVIGRLRRLKNVIAVLRSLNKETPIVVMDYETPTWLRDNYGPLARNLHLLTSVDTQADNPRLEAFRQKFQQQAQAKGRKVTVVDETAILAYESVLMLHSVAETHKTNSPIEIMTILNGQTDGWSGLTADRVGFNKFGDGDTRSVYLITLKDDDFVYSRKDGEL